MDLVHLEVEPKDITERDSCNTSNFSNPYTQNEDASETIFSTKKEQNYLNVCSINLIAQIKHHLNISF